MLVVLVWLLQTCLASPNLHLRLSSDEDSTEKLMEWALAFPSSKLAVYTNQPVSLTKICQLGYLVENILVNEEFLSEIGCPDESFLSVCVLNARGGMYAHINSNPATAKLLLDHAADDDHQKAIFRKIRTRNDKPCLNGLYSIDQETFFAPKSHIVLKEVMSNHAKNGAVMTEALSSAVKKNYRLVSFYQKTSYYEPTKKRCSTFRGVTHASGKIDESLPLLSLFQITSKTLGVEDGLKIKVDGGFLKCGDGEHFGEISISRKNQGEYNRWLETCTVTISSPITKITATLGESITVPIYDPSSLVTLVVKTFGRMSKVLSLVDSVSSMYPKLHIVVGDDGPEAMSIAKGQKRGFYYVPLSYDIGLSEGRNRLVPFVKTPYVLFLDDDFLMVKGQSNLALMIHELEMGYHDLVAGKSPNCAVEYAGKMRIVGGRRGRKLLLRHSSEAVQDSSCQRVDIVPNLFMTRTALFDGKLKWDPELKLGEHEDFFLRARTLGIRVGTCPAVAFEHLQDPPESQSSEYRKMRDRVWGFLGDFLEKRKLSELIAFGQSKAKLRPLSPVTRLSQLTALPFSAKISFQSRQPNLKYILQVESKLGDLVSTVVLENPFELLSLDHEITMLEPNSVYRVNIRPANQTIEAFNGPTITINTSSFARGNLLENPTFDGSLRGWRKSFGTFSDLLPQYFSQLPGFEEKRSRGEYEEHMEGRDSSWASRSLGRNDRNYAAYLSTPPSTIGNQWHSLYQDISGEKLPEFCKKGLVPCQIVASAWIRVDKIWGDPSSTRLVFEVSTDRAADEPLIKIELNPFKLDGWQYASGISYPISIDPAETITFAVRLTSNLGTFFLDDAYLSVIPSQ